MPYLMRELSSCFSRKHLFPFTISASHFLGLNHCDVPIVASTWQAFKVQWMLTIRSTDAHLVVIYELLQVRSNEGFNCFETLRGNKCYTLEEIILGFRF